ncbi:MAG TPA: prolyl oligopeptidase family serine peptidase [Gemmatimonadaceae bacterium]|nr:prolyl oligopeptidase family serine peptidase [Gemmatimonadaceae bacterium]
MTRKRGVHFRIGVVAALALVPLSGSAQVASTFAARDALGVTATSVVDLSDDGRWVLVTASLRGDALGIDFRRDGDPTYLRPGRTKVQLIETASGTARDVLPAPLNVRQAALSRDGTKVALLIERAGVLEASVWDRSTGKRSTVAVPAAQGIAENSDLRFTRDGRAVYVMLRSAAQSAALRAEFERVTKGPVFVQDGSDPFLAWDAMRRQGNIRSIARVDLTSGKLTELVPEMGISAFQVSDDDSLVVYQQDVTPKTDYDIIFGTENKLLARATSGATPVPPRTLLVTTKGTTIVWAPDGRRFAYAKDGKLYVQTALSGDAPVLLAGGDSTRTDERFTPLRFSPNADAIVLSNRQGLWLQPLPSGTRERIVETSDSAATTPRYTLAAFTPDGRYVYLTYASRQRWERGYVRYDRQSRQLEDVVKDAKLYSGLRIARAAETAVLMISDGNRPADVYAAVHAPFGVRRLTNANPQLATKAFGKTELVSYHDIDGKSRFAVVHYPPNYVSGRKYPTVFNVYEDFFDDTFDAAANVLAGAGYVVVKPSVGFDIGYPGEAWLKGVTAAANKLVEMGVADSARLGVHGTSYGGYATNLLITQTQRFKAAINISGKVDIISFYTDSPRLGVRNIHAAEKSQDRLGATLWQQPQKYVAHSAIMFADRITTPLLLMTGEQDSNVPAGNTREMYYALRRLGKEVVWVNYMNGGHGTPLTSANEFVDFHERMVQWYDKYLKGDGPRGRVEAVSLLGDSLVSPPPSPAARPTLERNLAAARKAYEAAPDNADSIVWLGRRTAYLGRFNDAIRIYSEGIEKFPNDARMYRHRGHRYISVRRFDDAISDFEKAVTLIRGQPDVTEPDGQPNARNTPTSTLQSNIWYHLGLAYYLKGDLENALRAYREDLKVAKNPDMLVAVSHWLYMTLRRLNRADEAATVLTAINKDMDIIENQSYHRLLLLYKGELTPDDLLKREGASDLDLVSMGYGVANWHLYNGRRAEAESVLRRVLGVRNQWAAFGFIAAEAEWKRLGAPRPNVADGAQ